MNKDSRILICGSHNILNKGFSRYFKERSFINIRDSNDDMLDLTSQNSVRDYFKEYRPNVVIYTGSLSGGISANMERSAEFIYKNIISQTNVLNSARDINAERLIYFGSSCVYPKNSPQPIKEEFLLTGELEQTSSSYAISKIAGIEMCRAYNKQYKTNFIPVVPATIYGPEDDFSLENGHVISSLIKRFYEAKKMEKDSVEIWGSGKPRREYIYIDDLVDASIFLLCCYKDNKHINVGCSKDYSISEIANIISKKIGCNAEIVYNKDKPDGVKQKLLDSTKINSMGWKSRVSIEEGIGLTHRWLKTV